MGSADTNRSRFKTLPKHLLKPIRCSVQSPGASMRRRDFLGAPRSATIALLAIFVYRIVVAAFLLASFACSVALAAEPKRVLVLHSFGRDFKPWSEHAKAIRTELDRQSPWPLEIIDKSLF